MKRWAAIARFGGIGDNLVAGSPLRPLKRLGYMCEVITSPPYHVVYLNNPFVDKLSVKVPERDLPKDPIEWQRFIDSRAREYDVFLHGSHSLEGRHSVFQNMTDFYLPQDYRRKRCGGSYIETAHDVIGMPYEFGPLYFPTAEEHDGAMTVKAQIGDRCIGWVLSGTRVDKVYPYAPMAIARIIKELDAPIVVFAGSSEKEANMIEVIKEVVIRNNGDRKKLHFAVPSARGEKCWPIRTQLALVHACDIIVGPDTGPMWAVAFEENAKVLMLSHGSVENVAKHWRNTVVLHADPYRVPCWPCHRLHDTIDTCVVNEDGNGAACISDITVEKLVTTVAQQWRNGKIIWAQDTFTHARKAG